jgi:hypothetical protein
MRMLTVVIPIAARRGLGLALRRSGGRRLACAALDDLVELAAVEPDAAALRAVIYLDALALAHDQSHTTGRTKQAEK